MSLAAVCITNQSKVINRNMAQKKCYQDKWYILTLYVHMLRSYCQHGTLWQMMIVAWVVTMLSHAAFNIHRSVSLLATPSGLESALAFQGNLSLYDAAISEPIFELLNSQQCTQTASKDMHSKGCRPLQKRFKLMSSVRKGLKSS